MKVGRKKNIEGLIPMFTVEIMLRKLTLSQQTMINSHTQNLFGCDRSTFFTIRFHPMPTMDELKDKKSWSPFFKTMMRIADYFGVPVDALINRTGQKIVEGEQLRLIDPDKTGSTQLEIKESNTTKKKKATA